MGKKQAFVIGASGTVGQATVKRLSSEFGDQVDVKAGVRSPQKASTLNGLKAVTVVQAAMGDRSGLEDIFRGVDSLFIVVPSSERRTHLAIETAKAAQEAGVKFLLLVSVPLVELPETIFGKQFSDIESTVSKLGIPCAFLRLPVFMEAFFGITPAIAKGSRVYAPVKADKTMAAIAVDDIGLAAATILASPEKHAGKRYTLVGDRVSYGEVTDAMSKFLGRKVEYVQVSYEDSLKGLVQLGIPEWQAKGIQEILKVADSGHPIARAENVNDFSEITGKKPTDLSTWLSKMATAFK